MTAVKRHFIYRSERVREFEVNKTLTAMKRAVPNFDQLVGKRDRVKPNAVTEPKKSDVSQTGWKLEGDEASTAVERANPKFFQSLGERGRGETTAVLECFRVNTNQ